MTTFLRRVGSDNNVLRETSLSYTIDPYSYYLINRDINELVAKSTARKLFTQMSIVEPELRKLDDLDVIKSAVRYLAHKMKQEKITITKVDGLNVLRQVKRTANPNFYFRSHLRWEREPIAPSNNVHSHNAVQAANYGVLTHSQGKFKTIRLPPPLRSEFLRLLTEAQQVPLRRDFNPNYWAKGKPGIIKPSPANRIGER